MTVTAKGQVTFRRAVLEHLGAGPGSKLVLDLLPGRLEVRAAPDGDIGAFIGCLAREGEGLPPPATQRPHPPTPQARRGPLPLPERERG